MSPSELVLLDGKPLFLEISFLVHPSNSGNSER